MKLVFILVMIFVVCYIPYQVQFLLLEFRVKVFFYWPPRHIFRRLVLTIFYHKAFMRVRTCRNRENQYV